MTTLTAPTTVARRPRRPRSNGSTRSGSSGYASGIAVGRPDPGRINRDAPGDGDLPLLNEIADQLRQFTNTDPATALRRSRQLLETAFRVVHDDLSTVDVEPV